MMKPQQIKQEILDGMFGSKDGLSINELTELLDVLIEVSKREGKSELGQFKTIKP